MRLWLYGVAMLLPAIGFAWRYPLRSQSNILTDIGKMARYEGEEFAGYVGGLALMFVLYLLAMREARRLPPRRALPAVFGSGVALAVAMAAMYPTNAIDIFIYSVRSRLFTEYDVNPLSTYPKDYPFDPFMQFASREWADNLSPYGPLWTLLAAPVTAISGDRILWALVGFKVLAVISVLAGGAIIAWTVVATRPGDAATATLFYLWNPLVLWEGIGNGHNDVVMTVPLLLALGCWVHRRDRWVIPWLIVATLIKYTPLLLLPLAVVALGRRAGGWPERWRLALWSGGLSLLAILIAFYPFYDLGAVRESIRAQGTIFLTSPAAVAIGLLRDSYDVDEIKQWARTIGQGILLLGLVVLIVRLWRKPDRLPRAMFEVIFLFLLVATWNFRAWYLVWPVALAALLPLGWPAWRMVAWSIGGLTSYGLFIWGWEWWKTDFYTIQNPGVLLMTGSAVLVTIVEIVRELRSRRPSSVETARGEPRTNLAGSMTIDSIGDSRD